MQNLRFLALAASCAAALCTAGAAQAAKVTVTMHKTTAKGTGEDLGTIAFEDTSKGMKIKPRLFGLPEGLHGFHLDRFANCGAKKKGGVMVPALAAGEPYGPGDDGKKDGKSRPGDLPSLYVHYDGSAFTPTVAPKLKTSELAGHAVVIDALGPAYHHHPKPIGGEIQRIACGVASR